MELVGPSLMACGFIHGARLTYFGRENPIESCQTAIVATKTVGHSRLMSTDKSYIPAALNFHRPELIEARAVQLIYPVCIIGGATSENVRCNAANEILAT